MKKAMIMMIGIIFLASFGFAQITSIYDIQFGGTSGVVTVQGIVQGTDNYTDLWIADAQGAYNGLFIYDATVSTTYVVGDEIEVSGTVSEYFNVTELGTVTAHSLLSSGNTPYAPAIVTCTDMDKTTAADTLPAEQYEGCLVKLVNVKCLTDQDSYYECDVTDDDSAHIALLDDDANYELDFGMSVDSYYDVTGVVQYKYDEFKVCPRDTTDIEAGSSVGDWELY